MSPDILLPDDKVLPGVIESCTNYVKHPGVVADRIERLVSVVGRERVMASSACGFASWVKLTPVLPEVVWMKLDSLAEGLDREWAAVGCGRERRLSLRAMCGSTG